jgi:hypothetical protein
MFSKEFINKVIKLNKIYSCEFDEPNNIITSNIVEIKLSKKDLDEKFNLSFMDPIIKDWIEHNIKYKLIIETIDYKLTIYSTNISTSINDLVKIVNRCYYGTINYFNISKSNFFLNLTYFMTPFQKKFTSLDEITRFNINNGQYDLTKNEITIWRIEEFPKVLIHELIHFFKINIKIKLINFNLIIKEDYIENEYELYTELNTWLLYQILFGLNLEKELEYSMILAIKILKMFRKGDEFHIKTNSNLLMYYVYKAFILNNIKELDISMNTFNIDMDINKFNEISRNVKLPKLNDSLLFMVGAVHN